MIKEIFQKLGFEATYRKQHDGASVKVSYIRNVDGSIRWFWPADQKEPLFLKFYNANGIRAKIFALGIKLMFRLRLSSFLYTRRIYFLKKTNAFLKDNNWAVFTGTVGPNRKAVLYENYNGEISFTKIAIGENSYNLIENERKVLNELAALKELKFTFPSVLGSSDTFLKLSDISEKGDRNSQLAHNHINMLVDLAKRTKGSCALKNSAFYKELLNNLDNLKNDTNSKIPKGIVRKIDLLVNSLDTKTEVITGLGHGDFTPWNMYCNKNSLAVYDWELAGMNYPAGYDAIHYVMQQSVLVDRFSWNKIKGKYFDTLKLYFEQLGLEDNFMLYVKLYFITNVTYNLNLFRQQKNWHTQVQWLIRTWNEAISDLLSEQESQRGLIISDLIDFMYDKNYAVLKYPGGLPESLSEYSDMDITIEKDDLKPLSDFLRNHDLAKVVRVIRKSFMANVQVITEQGEILNLDLIWKFKRKALEMMPVKPLLGSAYMTSAGVKVPSDRQLALFVGLFYGLNKSIVPEKYKYLAKVLKPYKSKEDRLLSGVFNGKDAGEITSYISAKDFNKGILGFKNKWAYLLDTIKSFGPQRGMVITFSGVDGAGKTTVINNVKHDIEKKLRRRVVVLRHRPSVLPILSAWTKGKEAAEREAANTLPRQGTNKSAVSSFFRFNYYFADYLLGQFWIWLFYVMRGTVVLYDRYYFDFINDAKRSNIELPEWMIKTGYNLLLKPHLNVFLYAKSEVILKRKKELSANDIDRLTEKYITLFHNLNKNMKHLRYLVIENNDLETTLDNINHNIIEKVAS